MNREEKAIRLELDKLSDAAVESELRMARWKIADLQQREQVLRQVLRERRTEAQRTAAERAKASKV